MRWIRQRINNIKLQNKLASIYIVTGLIPLFVLFAFAFGQMRSILMDRDLKSMQGSLEQSVATVDGQIEVYNNLSNYITFNETISSVLAYDYSSTYEMYSQIVTTFDPMLSSLRYFHNDINKVTVYVDNGIKHDTTIAPIDEIKNEPFFDMASDSTAINWYVDKDSKKLISARKMSTLEHMGITGIMYIDVSYDSVMSSYRQGLEPGCGIIVVDKAGEVIGEFNNIGDDSRYVLNYSDNNGMERQGAKPALKKMLGEVRWDGNICSNAGGYALVRKESPVTGWTTYIYEPRKMMFNSTSSITAMIIVAVVVALLGLAASITATSGFITKRIRKLKASMAKVEQGDFDAVIRTEDKDEIGELIQGFNEMTTQTKNLITQVYEGRISQKESEMKALRAQINPHFLNNTLEIINWKARMSGNHDVSGMIESLGVMMEATMNRKKEKFITIEEELKYVDAYLYIIHQRFGSRFHFDKDVDENLLNLKIPRLIVQPIVENAVEHGGDKEGNIIGSLKIYADYNNLYIVVHNNGNMTEADKAKIEILLSDQKLEENVHNIGIRNVNMRLKLLYGENSGLSIENVDDNLTESKLKIDRLKMEN